MAQNSRPVILDTNILVAAGFRPGSKSGQILQLVREGRLTMAWTAGTRGEIEHTIRRIPVLKPSLLEGLFAEAWRKDDPAGLAEFDFVEDPADRKFAALAVAEGIPLVSNDDHLLRWVDRIPAPVLRPGEFLHWLADQEAGDG
jgi:predicted nucleic acid-binding protein